MPEKNKEAKKQEQDKPLELPRCEFCGKPFIPRGPGQKYCKPSHRVAAFKKREETGQN